MGPEQKLEAKIVRALAKLLADEQRQVARWRTAGKISTLLGAVLWTVALFGYLQEAGGSWLLAVLAGVGGLCLGLGLWFTTFVEQWPAVRPYIDAEKVRQRATEIDRR